MHRNGGSTCGLCHFCEFHGVYIAAVPALAELDGHGDGHCCVDCADDLACQLGGAHERAAVAAFHHLAHRAAHVDVNEIRPGNVQRDFGSLRHDIGLMAEDLGGNGVVGFVNVQQVFCFSVAVYQRLCADHFRCGQCGTLLTADFSESGIGHPRHRAKGQLAVDFHRTYFHKSTSLIGSTFEGDAVSLGESVGADSIRPRVIQRSAQMRADTIRPYGCAIL